MVLLNSFVENIQQKYSSLNPVDFAKDAFKGAVNIGEAVLNVFNNTGIAGFKFQCPQQEQIKLSNQITTHYTETNSPVQDHLANEPIEITLKGFQGDYFYSLHEWQDTISSVVTAIPLITALMPQLDVYTQQVKSSAKQIYNTIKQSDKKLLSVSTNEVANTFQVIGIDLYNIYLDLYKLKSPQTRAYLFLEALWKAKLLFTVETSWKRFDNMAIQQVLPLRDNNADITDFTVKLQQINFTNTQTASIKANGRTRQQMAETVNQGVDKGKQVNFS